MHFEIKSTFQTIKNKVLRSGTSVKLACLIVALHTTLILYAAYAYWSNTIIPATIGSRYYGHYYVAILKAGIIAMIISGTYALLVILNHFVFSSRLRSTFRVRSSLKQ